MWRDELAQGFRISARGQVASWHRYQRLATLSFIVVMIFPISLVKKAPAEGIPQIVLEQEPKQEQLNRPEAFLASESTPATSPTTLPPAIFPTNQTPTVSVPNQRSIPAPTPTPVTTSQPLERPTYRVSPTPSSPPVIEFGQPLPKTYY